MISKELINSISRGIAWHYRIIPIQKEGNLVSFQCDQGADLEKLCSELEIVIGKQVRLIERPPSEIERLLNTYYYASSTSQPSNLVMLSPSDSHFLDQLILEARAMKSSDIHVECYEDKSRIRIRVDGLMVERFVLKNAEYPALINKIKIMANLDIAEKRLPQDGRIQYKNAEYSFDIRVSVLPTLYGEKVVLRLLNNNAASIDLESLGLSSLDLENYLDGVRKPNGIVLISGPTGSGKTTTLYATLKLLNKETRNILTIEDPIEYTLDGINQVQLRESIGLSFGSALRSFLRQDPDVIMVGEIRDGDTANMAIRAALTGHLVLSTIHTNSAWGTVSRLIDMGIPAFLLSSTLNTSVAQRLLRLLCPHCKQAAVLDPAVYPRQFKPFYEVSEHFRPTGCDRCYFTGYQGRRAVYEVVPIDRELSVEIKQGNMYVEHLLAQRNIKSLAENAFALFAQGKTSIEEVYPLLFNY